jgi:hypothetical protein
MKTRVPDYFAIIFGTEEFCNALDIVINQQNELNFFPFQCRFSIIAAPQAKEDNETFILQSVHQACCLPPGVYQIMERLAVISANYSSYDIPGTGLKDFMMVLICFRVMQPGEKTGIKPGKSREVSLKIMLIIHGKARAMTASANSSVDALVFPGRIRGHSSSLSLALYEGSCIARLR